MSLKELIEGTATETRRHFDVVVERLETAEFDRRVPALELAFADLQARVERLESTAH